MTTLQIVVPDDDPPMYGSASQADLQRLARYGNVTVHSTRATDREEFFRRIEAADVVINVRAYSVFDAQALEHASRLKLISIVGTGTDNVDVDAAARAGVVVTNTPGVGAPSVAELTVGLMLAVARAIPQSDRRLRNGTWQHVEGPELSGKTLGLLGLGAIGSRVATISRAFGMRVIAWSFRYDRDRAERLGVELVERDEIFRQSDVVSVHLRNTPEARGSIGRRELELMRPSAIFLNTARGALVDQHALAEALDSQRIAGAGLDVYAEEPLRPEANPFRAMDNVVLMPHAGAVTREANERQRKMPVDNVIAYLEGRPEHVVSPSP